MRIALGADHAGVHLKADIKQLLDARGIPYTDFGVDTTASVDYPDYAAKVAQEVGSGRFERGILFCGSGVGMAIAANKIHGVRAAAIVDETSARLSREHNDINVLSLGERLTAPDQARRFVEIFLDTPFAAGRHTGRVDKIMALEQAPAVNTP